MTQQVPPGTVLTSLVIVSRHRTETLLRCLTGVAQMDHPAFEVIVVADPASLAALAQAGLGSGIRQISFDRANISQARNLGIVAAAGEVVAFLDDDAVPEPTWLSRLTAVFRDPAVTAAGGWTRSRNGISWQWQGGLIDRLTRPLPLERGLCDRRTGTRLFRAPAGQAIEVKGVNCAYRRADLLAAGGFDPELRYYLDETELNLRLSGRGAVVAVVPGAVVHHFKAGSRQRSPHRVPLSLADVGASSAVTLRRNAASPAEAADRLRELEAHERRKLIRHMVAGNIEPRDVLRLMRSLRSGWEDGMARPLVPVAALTSSAQPEDFLHFQTERRPGIVLSGRLWQARRLRRDAAAAAAEGRIVTVILLGRNALWHWMRYDSSGFWEQSGGQWGWSAREGHRFLRCSFRGRVSRECLRIADDRPISAEMPKCPDIASPKLPECRLLSPRG